MLMFSLIVFYSLTWLPYNHLLRFDHRICSWILLVDNNHTNCDCSWKKCVSASDVTLMPVWNLVRENNHLQLIIGLQFTRYSIIVKKTSIDTEIKVAGKDCEIWHVLKIYETRTTEFAIRSLLSRKLIFPIPIS